MRMYGWVVVGAVILLVGGGLWYASKSVVAPTEEVVGIRVQVEDAGASLITVPSGSTAIAATEMVAELTLEGEGALASVTAIDGVVADVRKREFWKLIVNDTEVLSGAGSYVVQSGDSIVWEIDRR